MDTVTRPTASEPAFHADDVDQVADYRTVSVAAIISLLIGLAAPLCLLSRLFLVLPLCGVALSLLALSRIATSDGRMAGRWAAIAGLALCVASGVAAMSRDGVTRTVRTVRAEDFGQTWLSVLTSNKTDQAFRMTFEGARPSPPPEPGAPPATTSPYEEFTKNELVRKISMAGASAKIVCVETQEFNALSRSDFLVRQRFQITPQGDAGEAGSTNAIEVDLTLQRSRFAGQRERRWLVTKFEPPPATGNSAHEDRNLGISR